MWMKNTYISLDIVFALARWQRFISDSGHSTAVAQSLASREPVQYVLELNAVRRDASALARRAGLSGVTFERNDRQNWSVFAAMLALTGGLTLPWLAGRAGRSTTCPTPIT